ncbi:hypothetical protein [Pelotomaculum sp. FP]|nr:hypothetical protein [Pelotomaculum sp. FP]
MWLLSVAHAAIPAPGIMKTPAEVGAISIAQRRASAELGHLR